MAPPTVYKGGIKPVHLLTDHSRYTDFKEKCQKEGKSVNQRFNELMVQDLECISCLGFEIKPVQQKIDDSINDDNNDLTLEKITIQLEALLEKLPKAIVATITPPPKNKHQFRAMAQQISRVQRLLNDGNKNCNIQQEQLRRKTATAGVMT